MTTPIYKEGNPMTTPVYAAVNDQLTQDDDPVAANGQMAEEATMPDGATDVDDDAEQALVVDEWDAESLSPVMPAAQPMPAPQPPPVVGSTPPPVVGSTPPSAAWSEILAMFVDDPRACVELAASLVDDSVEAHVMSIKEQQQSLLSGWRDDGVDTEDLRVALQHYRTFWTRLKDLPAQA
jgi:hypothetical protein